MKYPCITISLGNIFLVYITKKGRLGDFVNEPTYSLIRSE
jgi:hypothetical protein